MLRKPKTERMIWIDIIITLLALELMAYFYYGLRAIIIGGLCIAVSIVAEIISLRLMKRKFTADDLTSTSDALIISLMMPAVIEYEIPALACVFAVIVAKNIFGGRINMIFSPAAAAYLFILTSWKSSLLTYPNAYDKISIFEKSTDLVNSASYVLNNTGKMNASDFEILLGNFSGPMGAVSILLLLVSAVILIFRKDISAGAFIGTMTGTIFLAYLCPIANSRVDSVKYVLATNMILFAAVYIISDLRIAPKKNYYAFFYGFFISVTSYVIMLTTGKENVIVIMSVLFTPVSLAFKNLQKKIDNELILENEKNDGIVTSSSGNENPQALLAEFIADEKIEEIAETAIAEIEDAVEADSDSLQENGIEANNIVIKNDEDNNPEGAENIE